MNCFSYFGFSWLLLASISPASGTLRPLGEHVDVRWIYDRDADTWNCVALVAGGEQNQTIVSWNDAFLVLSDRPSRPMTPSNSGSRNIQSGSASYAFTGVMPGNPIWIAPQGTPGLGESWPGMENNQAFSQFGSYIETDTRLPNQSEARPWLKISLKEMTYQGSGSDPIFSYWGVSGGTPRVWMRQSDGIGPSDYFLYSAGTHTHANWGFSEMGIFQLGFSASGFRGPGQTNPTSESQVVPILITVGPIARWQAEVFPRSKLLDASFCGMLADPDQDGWKNLLEYAFGTSPMLPDSSAHPAELGLPRQSIARDGSVTYQVLEFPRRKALESIQPLIYQPEFSNNLEVDSWQAADPAWITVSEISGSLAATWEWVRIQRPLPSGEKSSFARVRVIEGVTTLDE